MLQSVCRIKIAYMSQEDEKNTFKVMGEDLVKQIKKLLHEGNIRKILIKDEKGTTTYLEIPVTIGVIGTLIAPVLAAIGALAAMVGFVTIEVVKVKPVDHKTTKEPSKELKGIVKKDN
jgi:hypothetical protein